MLDLPVIAAAADVPSALGAIVSAVARGSITCEEAQALGSVVEAARRGLELAEIEMRVKLLEQRARDT